MKKFNGFWQCILFEEHSKDYHKVKDPHKFLKEMPSSCPECGAETYGEIHVFTGRGKKQIQPLWSY